MALDARTSEKREEVCCVMRSQGGEKRFGVLKKERLLLSNHEPCIDSPCPNKAMRIRKKTMGIRTKKWNGLHGNGNERQFLPCSGLKNCIIQFVQYRTVSPWMFYLKARLSK